MAIGVEITFPQSISFLPGLYAHLVIQLEFARFFLVAGATFIRWTGVDTGVCRVFVFDLRRADLILLRSILVPDEFGQVH